MRVFRIFKANDFLLQYVDASLWKVLDPRAAFRFQLYQLVVQEVQWLVYGAPFVKILYLTDLAQKLLSLPEIAISACRDVISGCYECCKFVLPLRFIPWARPVFLISCFWRHSSRVIRRVGVINKALVRCCSFAVETQSVGRPAHIVSCSSARRFGVNAWTWRFYIVHV